MACCREETGEKRSGERVSRPVRVASRTNWALPSRPRLWGERRHHHDLAVVSGVVGADLSRTIIIILGFANLFADGISMGASNYLARRSTAELEPRASREDAFRHASATIVAFVLAGLVPLAAYLLPLPSDSRFIAAVFLTAATLFSVGAARTFVTGLSPLRSGLEMLLIGALAAVAAYLIGAFASLFTETGPGSSHTR